MPKQTEYLHVHPEAVLPTIALLAPFRAIVIADTAVSQQWQNLVSDWLVGSGCLTMLAWGVNCSSWDDALDWANIAQFTPHDIPEAQFVMTTWHDEETLEEVFWFAKQHGNHPIVQLERTLLLHIGPTNQAQAMLRDFHDA